MAKMNSGKNQWIWLSVFVLFVCVAATTIAVFSRLDGFLFDDEGAIPLIPETASGMNDGADETREEQGSDATESLIPTTKQESANSGDTAPEATLPPKNPGFQASDNETVWSTDTRVEIFRVSYADGEQVITVKSGNGEKIIAPGTENSYVFKLKNTGDVAMDYKLEVDASFAPTGMEIPITARLNRYDGAWVVGGKDTYEKASVLDAAEDRATLGVGKYSYYTLDWLWPFEGDDQLDTLLGDLAEEQDLVFTVTIRTYATESDDPNADGGITPQTGDQSRIALWIVLAISSLVMMILLLFRRDEEKRRDGREAKIN